MRLTNFLFGYFERVCVVVEAEDVERAEKVFERYSGKFCFKGKNTNELSWSVMRVSNEEKDKIALTYLVDALSVDSVLRDLCSERIAGYNKFTPIFFSPYSIRRVISSKIEKIMEKKGAR